MSHLTCPCHSQKLYKDCCRPYHLGKLPENALLLMRSRYSAYALQLADYIIATTHPDNPQYSSNQKQWKEDILKFTNMTAFEGLKILEFIDGEQKAWVTFTAKLKQQGQDVSFTEKSAFEKVNGKWLYKNGTVSKSKNS